MKITQLANNTEYVQFSEDEIEDFREELELFCGIVLHKYGLAYRVTKTGVDISPTYNMSVKNETGNTNSKYPAINLYSRIKRVTSRRARPWQLIVSQATVVTTSIGTVTNFDTMEDLIPVFLKALEVSLKH